MFNRRIIKRGCWSLSTFSTCTSSSACPLIRSLPAGGAATKYDLTLLHKFTSTAVYIKSRLVGRLEWRHTTEGGAAASVAERQGAAKEEFLWFSAGFILTITSTTTARPGSNLWNSAANLSHNGINKTRHSEHWMEEIITLGSFQVYCSLIIIFGAPPRMVI